MVHTEPCSAKHYPYLPQLGAVAFSSAPHFWFLRPGHAEHPEGSWWSHLRKQRKHVLLPNSTQRVAVADDADPWVDLGLQGEQAEATRWIRGKWIKGVWHAAGSEDSQPQAKVAEGRVIGYSSWTRNWPEDPETAKLVMERCGAGTVWSTDSLWKKLNRGLFTLADAYFTRINPDPAEAEAIAQNRRKLFWEDGGKQFMEIAQPVFDRCKHVGFIMLDSIAVDPSYGRRGIGARLMRWGLERAEQERCPILLIATGAGSLLYNSLGFETRGTISIPGLSGDQVMVYWPKSFQGSGSPDTDVQADVVKDLEKTEVKTQEATVSVSVEASEVVATVDGKAKLTTSM